MSPAARAAKPAARSARSRAATACRIRVDRDTVVAGLLREAASEEEGSTQANRIKAWELLARMLGFFEAAEAQEPLLLTVNFGPKAADCGNPDAPCPPSS